MYVTVNGARLFFDVDGELLSPSGKMMEEKPTVVMVHGGPGADHSVAKPYFSQITDIAQVVYYDQRGNGRSELSGKKTWNLDQWSDDLKAFCDTLGIENPIVIGTSFGGFVTIAYASKYPEHPGALVLISTAAKVDFDLVYAAFERRGGEEIGKIAKSYWQNPTSEGREKYKRLCVPLYSFRHKGQPEWISRVLWRDETAIWFNGPRNEHGSFDYRETLRRVCCPVLVMAGEDDPIAPPEFSDTIVDCLPSDTVTYRKFRDCGHGVVVDKPLEALSILRNFITRES